MKQFLNKNEGLRSRIAFHLDFPDYNETEMVEILKLMIREKGYLCSDEALEKCRGIFAKAVLQEEFGNGRYVRNVLEQAMMKQSRRFLNTARNILTCSKSPRRLSSRMSFPKQSAEKSSETNCKNNKICMSAIDKMKQIWYL